jgi:hypothetical protein
MLEMTGGIAAGKRKARWREIFADRECGFEAYSVRSRCGLVTAANLIGYGVCALTSIGLSAHSL